MKILTAAEMRQVDRLSTERFSIASLTLMENAGKSAAEFIRARFSNLERRSILVLCGKGNNGGDGFVVARHLVEMGARPVVFLFAEIGDLHGDAALSRKRLENLALDFRVIRDVSDWRAWKPPLASAEVIVDALLGTGIRGPVDGLLAEAIADVNRHALDTSVVAVDIPSGLDADSGAVHGAAVVADYTVTFTAPKIGMFLGLAAHYVGRLMVRDIGSPRELVESVGQGRCRWSEPAEFSHFAAPRRSDANKGDYGHALIVAGSVGKSGAAVLASWAALRAGAGLVTAAVAAPILPILAAHIPEIMTAPLPATDSGAIARAALDGEQFDSLLKGKRALAIGPGLGQHVETQEFIRSIVARPETAPIVLDADGLNAFDGRATELRRDGRALAITPHPGEMGRLLDKSAAEVQARRLDAATKSAAEWNAFVVLKGSHTVVSAPSGVAWINSTGNPGMSTGGTGDVLTGVLAGLTAQFGAAKDWDRMLAFGVYLHGLAGDLASADAGEAPLMASDLIYALPRAYKHFFAALGRV
ncbi:MAG: NAD(P)H-hydrate dehydratase [Candidatus Acidiferrales bacterium]